MIRLIFILSLFSSSAFALTCIENPAGLAASVQKSGDQIKFRFVAGRGYDSIPQVEGPIGGVHLWWTKYQIESLKELGDTFEFSMPLSACDLKRASEGIFSCSGKVEIPGTKLAVLLFDGYRIKQSHASGEYETQNFKIMIDKTDIFSFLVPFPARACSGSVKF